MTVPSPIPSESPEEWFQPILIPAGPYQEFSERLDQALKELESKYAEFHVLRFGR